MGGSVVAVFQHAVSDHVYSVRRHPRLLDVRCNITRPAPHNINNISIQLGSRVVSVLDSDAERPRFKSQSGNC